MGPKQGVERETESGHIHPEGVEREDGSLTTFSTYSLDTIHMLQAGKFGKALAFVLVNNAGCLAATALALRLGGGGTGEGWGEGWG
ncbi:hypothetical protein NSK_005861 [Nannochloropsis salina CCMP1776]|uniref:Uncharacterized protein n=1 Tax=Nannochloropsis salina CCMP1776 TaxID=1027361 RepID=A0A4D9CW83_9STRA|nr:hypothetical protein NSK_005861 [Nannochloropsis salina CCMP1776]|eukprot:TFJ82854.1 hypothetical protein NSK_005861 [Nannochloropsis salina CCMP1776]